MKNQNGFTLVEVLVYLALFGLVFSGLLASAFAVIENMGRSDTQIMTQAEGLFLLSKIEKKSADDGIVEDNGVLKINGVSLNNSQTIVDDLKFDDLGGGLAEASFSLSAKTAGGKNYSKNFSTICKKQ